MTYKIKGILYYTDYSIIMNYFGEIFKELKMKPRLFGYDITCSNNTAEVFITTTDNNQKQYYVDILLMNNEMEILKTEDLIKKNLLKSDILFDLSFIKENDTGEEIEECQFVHPDFANRFYPPS